MRTEKAIKKLANTTRVILQQVVKDLSEYNIGIACTKLKKLGTSLDRIELGYATVEDTIEHLDKHVLE